MPFGIGATLQALGGLGGEGIKFLAFEQLFRGLRDGFTGAAAGSVSEKVVSGITNHGAKWWGLDRSDDQLLILLYTALYENYKKEYEGLREALDVLWQKLLDRDCGRGKWAKRWRMTLIGISIDKTAPLPDGTRKVKARTPVVDETDDKKAKPVLGPDKQPLYKAEYVQGARPLELSKKDPRVIHLYGLAKMARAELDSGELGSENLPKTINHLMVTFLQDDPFFRLIGEKWRAFITWLEGRHPLRQAEAFMWLTSEERSRINGLSLTEQEKTDLRTLEIQMARDLFERDLREAKEEPSYKPFLRFWWLFALVATVIFIALSL